MENSVKILLYDLEVSPSLGYVYGKFKTNVLKFEKYADIMSISWQWYGEDTVHHASASSIARKRGTSTSKALALLIRGLFDQADIVVAHNAYGFDNKVATASFIRHGLTPPSPYKTVDTLRVARNSAKFPGGNSLDELGRYLGLGTKTETQIRDLWYDCLQGKREAWKLLKEYNNQDVVLLHKIYERLLPYIKNHPNLGDILQRDGVCPKCGSNHLQKRGFNHRRNGKAQRYQCMTCGGWSNEATLKGNGRTVNA